MTPGRDGRREACDALARRLVTPEGLETATLLDLVRAPRPEDTPPEPSPEEVAEAIAARYLGDTPGPIGIWKPETNDAQTVFVRDDSAATRDWWPAHERLTTKGSLLPLRVVLLGESTAAGWFYAPALTPAAVLRGAPGRRARARHLRGPRPHDGQPAIRRSGGAHRRHAPARPRRAGRVRGQQLATPLAFVSRGHARRLCAGGPRGAGSRDGGAPDHR